MIQEFSDKEREMLRRCIQRQIENVTDAITGSTTGSNCKEEILEIGELHQLLQKLDPQAAAETDWLYVEDHVLEAVERVAHKLKQTMLQIKTCSIDTLYQQIEIASFFVRELDLAVWFMTHSTEGEQKEKESN